MYIATTTLGSHMAVRLDLEKKIAKSVRRIVVVGWVDSAMFLIVFRMVISRV